MLELFCLTALVVIYFVAVAFATNNAYKKKQSAPKLSPEKIVYVDYKGFSIPMKQIEKTTIWRNLTTKGKKAVLADWKKYINHF